MKNDALLIIQPLTIGRKQGADILAYILEKTNTSLVRLRPWTICGTTLRALYVDASAMRLPVHQRECWICQFTSCDASRSAYDQIAVIRPQIVSKWRPLNTPPKVGDTVIRLTEPARLDLELALLFI